LLHLQEIYSKNSRKGCGSASTGTWRLTPNSLIFLDQFGIVDSSGTGLVPFRIGQEQQRIRCICIDNRC
jgi:hypothetical protein